MKNTVKILSFLSVALLVVSFLMAAFLIDRSAEEKRSEKETLERELESLRRSINIEKSKNVREAIDRQNAKEAEKKKKESDRIIKETKIREWENRTR